MLGVTNFSWGHYDYDNMWRSKLPNSAGGISVKYDVKNYSSKDIKKYRIYFEAYNGADEVVSCKATGRTKAGVECADRLSAYGKSKGCLCENAWYNISIRDVKISRIEVDYADGTTESCAGNYTPNQNENKNARQKEHQDGMTRTVKILSGLVIGFSVLFLCSLFVSFGRTAASPMRLLDVAVHILSLLAGVFFLLRKNVAVVMTGIYIGMICLLVVSGWLTLTYTLIMRIVLIIILVITSYCFKKSEGK